MTAIPERPGPLDKAKIVIFNYIYSFKKLI